MSPVSFPRAKQTIEAAETEPEAAELAIAELAGLSSAGPDERWSIEGNFELEIPKEATGLVIRVRLGSGTGGTILLASQEVTGSLTEKKWQQFSIAGKVAPGEIANGTITMTVTCTGGKAKGKCKNANIQVIQGIG